MSTGSEIVTRAYREGNLVAIGTDLTSNQLAEGLLKLNSYIDTLYGFELGEFLFDWPFPPRNTSTVNTRYPLFPRNEALPSGVYQYPPPNVRILLGVTDVATVPFPPQPKDGARITIINNLSTEVNVTLSGNGRMISSAASVTALPSSLDGRKYLYRADLGSWQLVEEVTETSTSPLPPLYDELLILGVLERLGPTNGRDLQATQLLRKERMLKRLKTQYRQPTPEPVDQYSTFLIPIADYSRGGFYDSNEGLMS